MRQLVLVIFVLTIISKSVFGQMTNYRFQKGIIIKKDGTAINGYVKLAVTYYSKVVYMLTEDGNEYSIRSSGVKSIKTPYKYIENITLDGKERLMAMVADGKVKLFSYVTTNSGKTKQKQDGNYDEASTIVYALQKGENFIELNSEHFKANLSEQLNDQPLLVEKINGDKFKFENIEQIVNEYNGIYKRRQVIAKVIDSETKKPIKDVRVTIHGTNNEQITNFLGFIQITIDTVDTLIIFHPEYEIGQIKVPEVDNFQISLTRIPIRKKRIR